MLLDDLNIGINRLISLLESQQEKGLTYAIAPFTLSTFAEIWPKGVFGVAVSLFSIAITNDGPGDCDCSVNVMYSSPARLQAGDVFRVSFATAQIHCLFLTPVSGATPSIRGFGTY
jgi:hypothetical protein